MKKTTLQLITLLLCMMSYAQQQTYLDVGNIKALINADGNLFQDLANYSPGFEAPKNSNKYSIYASSFWISSTSTRNGIPHTASTYETYGNENNFNIGPVDIINQTSLNSPQFNRLWEVNKFEITNHIQNWNTSNYVIPNNILNWPGNGNANTAQNLAPYFDINNNNIYEPQNGEYPLIKGDQAVYLILNDYRGEDTLRHLGNVVETYGPLKIETHLMLYAFASSTPAIHNTVFVEATLYNRSNSQIDNHNDLKFSVFADFDLGNPTDDYVGTSISRSMFFAYNGDMFDDNTNGNLGYGSQLASQGIKFLDYNIDHSIYYNNGSAQNGDPSLPSHFSNFQRGLWKNGSPIRHGGDGYLSSCSNPNQYTTWMYYGDPNLSSSNTQWTETNPCINSTGNSNAPGDRRMVGGPTTTNTLLHGNKLQFSYAYIFAQDSQNSQTIASPVSKLFREADIVQAFFDNTIIGMNEIETEQNKLSIFPNPAMEIINIETSTQIFTIELLDLKGSVLKTKQNANQLDISSFANGIYFIRIKEQNKIQTKKLIISK